VPKTFVPFRLNIRFMQQLRRVQLGVNMCLFRRRETFSMKCLVFWEECVNTKKLYGASAHGSSWLVKIG
jgi:hypothetical protein